jgi:hypothetical protein
MFVLPEILCKDQQKRLGLPRRRIRVIKVNRLLLQIQARKTYRYRPGFFGCVVGVASSSKMLKTFEQIWGDAVSTYILLNANPKKRKKERELHQTD